MQFFESLLLLLLVAIILLQVSRRLLIPYPSMLALAGIAVAIVPGTPDLTLDPQIALALFIAPALLDAAYDFPLGTARRFWLPLLVFAIGGVVVTTLTVALAGWTFAGLPFAAALVLGAIVAPPDAAASTAVLSSVSVPRNVDAVLRGESLFNDAAALLIFTAALSVQSAGALDGAETASLVLAAPGGILLGVASAWVLRYLYRFVVGTLGGNILQFVQTFLLWILAERLHLSPVLAIVAFAMTTAYFSDPLASSARMRVQSYAVWSVVVFVLNVMAFLLMGMQVRAILADMEPNHMGEAALFAGGVVVIVIVTRFALCIGFNRYEAYAARRDGRDQPPSFKQAILAGWCGMRGLLTLATAFALPGDFPNRNVVVLTAFAVVLATVVIQGLSLRYVIQWLRFDLKGEAGNNLNDLRRDIAIAGLSKLEGATGDEAELLRTKMRMEKHSLSTEEMTSLKRYRTLALDAIAGQRQALERLRIEHQLNPDLYNLLLEEIDWRELSVLPEEERRIEEI
ncbi:sodium:proton antiporter [Neorhizobium lilium]|uniref:Sodium:proton antiporter n=1 Tax=Neorhizobium lilium TaxID=2503024 RepID=A0A3S4UQE0_9HYPH|nr:cation:proton antiporter [Neorhizobium lilium]RWX78691.1 sodium:proton antiporter [Neorhizobium lilium]